MFSFHLALENLEITGSPKPIAMDNWEKDFYNAILVTAVLIGSILCFSLVSLIRLHRRYVRLARVRREEEILMLERERTRIATDLHDELGPMLSAVKFKLGSVETGDPAGRSLLEQSSAHLDSIIERVRAISNGLMPNALLRKGALAAIREFIAREMSAFPVRITLTAGRMPALTQEQSIHLYRILQEVIHNTVRHAQATELVVEMSCHDQGFFVRCRDNGIGFDRELVLKEKAGLGLYNLQSRVEMLGGLIEWRSGRARGTEVLIDLPVS